MSEDQFIPLKSFYNLPIAVKQSLIALGSTLSFTTLFTLEVIILKGQYPELNFGNFLTKTLGVQFPLITLIISINLVLLFLLRQAIVKPIQELQQKTLQFTQGNKNIRLTLENQDEIGQLAQTFNQLAETTVQTETVLRKEAKQTQILASIARTRDPKELKVYFNELLSEVRDFLQVDRAVIYRFYPNWSGYIAGESITGNFPTALADKIEDPCIGEELINAYKKGRIVPTSNVYEAGFHPDHLALMKRLQIKANLVTPILQGEDLYGLLVAHHCAVTHDWQTSEIDYLTQVAGQLGLALSNLGLLERRSQEADRAKQQNEALQQELLNFLEEVELASAGDLTVRAEITAGEIGIVADFFNAIIENLRDIVTQVKYSTKEVNDSLGNNDQAMQELAEESLKQAKKITRMLDFVEEMANSIQEVARNAGSAAEVARIASQTAEQGGVAMDQTVQSILQLRETIGETAKQVKRLGESSQQISKVISLINQIALQTNLLAINASIEAARAGEEGRGFAVVAEEVGQLAVQSATATKEIEQIVASIQTETSKVVSAMEIGTSQVVEGTKIVETAKENLGKIVEVSRKIDQLVADISQETVSQTKTSAMVTNLMKDIAKVSEKTSQFSRQVSTSLQDTVSIAKQLRSSVETFKVESNEL